jgi:hypothetical protein
LCRVRGSLHHCTQRLAVLLGSLHAESLLGLKIRKRFVFERREQAKMEELAINPGKALEGWDELNAKRLRLRRRWPRTRRAGRTARRGPTRIVDENVRVRAGRQHELSTLFRRDVGSDRNNVDVCLRIRTVDLPAHPDVQKRCCNDLCMCGR